MIKGVLVSEEFLKEEMPFAFPLYVTIYLATETFPEKTSAEIALFLNVLETDVLKACAYWIERGYMEADKLEGANKLPLANNVNVNSIKDNAVNTNNISANGVNTTNVNQNNINNVTTVENKAPQTPKQYFQVQQKPTYTTVELNEYMKDNQLSELVSKINMIVPSGDPLNQQHMNTILTCHDYYGLSLDVVYELYVFCIDNNKFNGGYIEKVAQTWSEQSFKTAVEAREHARNKNDNYREILKAFNKKEFSFSPEEEDFMKSWINKFKFPMDLIKEACSRTYNKKKEANFNYANGILLKWSDKNIKTLEDIAKEEEDYKKKNNNNKNYNNSNNGNNNNNNYTYKPQSRPTAFNNFEQREDGHVEDMSDLVSKLAKEL